jgi:hypothetical protein
VQFYFVGHLHQYVRFVPNYGTKQLIDLGSVSADGHVYTNPKFTTTIITGSPGNQEVQPSDCGGVTPSNPAYPTIACSQNYGYGYLQILNSSHATWVWNTSVPISGSPDPFYSDYLTVIRDPAAAR